MRAHRSLVLAAAVLLGGGFVGRPAAIAKDDAKAAATAHLQWAKSTADAMAEARERGCVIFATYHGDG